MLHMHKSLLCPYPGFIFSMSPELVVVFHRMLCDFEVVDSGNVSLTNEHARICIFTQNELLNSYQFTTRYYSNNVFFVFLSVSMLPFFSSSKICCRAKIHIQNENVTISLHLLRCSEFLELN